MKNYLLLLTVLLFTSCGTFKISTLNYDPIYDGNGNEIEVNVINNEFELDRKFRTDFQFRYNYAQYAISQPISFDWNNRFFRNTRFNRYNNYNHYGWGYSSFWNRDQMWMDWVWGYPYGNGMGWSYSWGNNSWSSNHWNSPYGWNNYYGWGNGYGWNNNGWNNNGWNNGYRRGSNVAYNIGRRGSTMSVRDRIGQGAMIQSTKVKKRRTINTNVTPIPNNTRVREVRSSEVRVIKPRRASTVITPIRNNRNTTPIRNYNNKPTNNSRSVRTNIPTTPNRSSKPIRTKGRGNN
jgi:hypothetical protein